MKKKKTAGLNVRVVEPWFRVLKKLNELSIFLFFPYLFFFFLIFSIILDPRRRVTRCWFYFVSTYAVFSPQAHG
jgi:hypothetical protein